ncbi:MAG: YceI family protein, partial [Flavobacteriales bacterium]
MKPTILTITAAAAMLVACGPSEAEKQAAREKAIADSIAAAAAAEHKYTINPAASTLTWAGNVTGAKVYGHHGTLAFTSGEFTVQGGQLKAGSFVVDMNSITPTDDAYQPDGSKQGTRAHLVEHLKTADFFDVANHPTAKLT